MGAGMMSLEEAARKLLRDCYVPEEAAGSLDSSSSAAWAEAVKGVCQYYKNSDKMEKTALEIITALECQVRAERDAAPHL